MLPYFFTVYYSNSLDESIGIDSQVRNSYFWYDRTHNSAQSDAIYREFKSFLNRQIDNGAVKLEAGVEDKIDNLKKEKSMYSILLKIGALIQINDENFSKS